MSRFHQRLRAALQNPEVAAGYREAAAERAVLDAIEHIREQQGVSKEQLAARMGRRREAISRVLAAQDSNPTLETIIALCEALGITADITFRQARSGEAPIQSRVVLQEPTLNGFSIQRFSVPLRDTPAPLRMHNTVTSQAPVDVEGEVTAA